MSYWLMKSEPDVFSFQDLMRAKERTTGWEGVRNYQARNFMREMRVRDRVLYYHSSTALTGIVGIAQVVREAYPDPIQFDASSDYFDPKSTPDNPRWFQVDVQGVLEFPNLVSLEKLRQDTKLDGMKLLQKGSRLSVQPVSDAHWKHILKLAGINEKSIPKKDLESHE
jgi:predicted RNA-binding protein with PUA-like domain